VKFLCRHDDTVKLSFPEEHYVSVIVKDNSILKLPQQSVSGGTVHTQALTSFHKLYFFQ
jgi:hypothetical protein